MHTTHFIQNHFIQIINLLPFSLSTGMECDHEIQHQLTRDWLMALLICLGILLMVMFCVNLFLCSSMACTCYRQEIIDTSSVDDRNSHQGITSYDYDPYKPTGNIHSNGSYYADPSLTHPLYASLQRKPNYTQSMIEDGAPTARHPHIGSPHREIDIHRETYSIGLPGEEREKRTRSRHSNYY